MALPEPDEAPLSRARLINYINLNITATEKALKKATGSRKVHHVAQLQMLTELLNKVRAGDFNEVGKAPIH